jgi:DNA excision repair protein ERCC-6
MEIMIEVKHQSNIFSQLSEDVNTGIPNKAIRSAMRCFGCSDNLWDWAELIQAWTKYPTFWSPFCAQGIHFSQSAINHEDIMHANDYQKLRLEEAEASQAS